MVHHKLSISVGIMFTLAVTSISGCSVFRKKDSIAINEKLIIPPSLRTSSATAQNTTRSPAQKQHNSNRVKTVGYAKPSNKNYYIVVGTYPSQDQALDTFTRLSSIGLPGAAMESRKTKSGKLLHMVRLGPYQKQEDIDKVKDSLTSDGLSQFKVVEN